MKKYILCVGALILLFGCVEDQGATTPGLDVSDQEVSNQVIVDYASINATGWVAIYNELNGQPNTLIGYAKIPEGTSNNITVNVSNNMLTETLYAVLQYDLGEEDRFEFPGADSPVTMDGSFVAQSFTVLNLNQTDNATNVTDNETNETNDTSSRITPISGGTEDNETNDTNEDDNVDDEDTDDEETDDEDQTNEDDEAIGDNDTSLEYAAEDGLGILSNKGARAIYFKG